MTRRFVLLSLLSLLAVRAAPPPAAHLQVLPRAPRQGQALLVTLSGPPPAASALMLWDARRYPIYSTPTGWRSVIPLRVEERVGRHRLRLSYRAPGEAWRTVDATVPVGRTVAPVQHLKMARSIERLYTYPGRQKELALVGRAIRTETPRQRWTGDFMMPIHGRVSTPFGTRRIRNGRLVGYHLGMDIAAPTGTPIHVDSAGRVMLARSLIMHGKTVVIDHGLGVVSIFLHQSALRCHEGQEVRRGDVIGEVGQTGVATGPHLHWGVYVHGTPVSPLFWTHLPGKG